MKNSIQRLLVVFFAISLCSPADAAKREADFSSSDDETNDGSHGGRRARQRTDPADELKTIIQLTLHMLTANFPGLAEGTGGSVQPAITEPQIEALQVARSTLEKATVALAAGTEIDTKAADQLADMTTAAMQRVVLPADRTLVATWAAAIDGYNAQRGVERSALPRLSNAAIVDEHGRFAENPDQEAAASRRIIHGSFLVGAPASSSRSGAASTVEATSAASAAAGTNALASGDDADIGVCPICQEAMHGKAITSLPCGHTFDEECAINLFTRAIKETYAFPPCPLCRFVLKDIPTSLNEKIPTLSEDNFLIMAANNGALDLVTQALNHGANVNAQHPLITRRNGTTDPRSGNTALHFAVLGNYVEVINYLISQSANIDQPNTKGLPPLHLAAVHGHTEAIFALIEKGAKVNQPGPLGYTPLHVAARNNQANAINALVAQGASVNELNTNGNTPLHLAASKGHVDAITALIADSANVNSRDCYYTTPLHLAAKGGHVAAIRELIARGASIDSEDCDGYTPLHLAAKEGHVAAIRVLLANGASIDSKDYDGCTPLHVAAYFGNYEVITALIERGADKASKNNDGQTAFDIISQYSYGRRITDLLRLPIRVHASAPASTAGQVAVGDDDYDPFNP